MSKGADRVTLRSRILHCLACFVRKV